MLCAEAKAIVPVFPAGLFLRILSNVGHFLEDLQALLLLGKRSLQSPDQPTTRRGWRKKHTRHEEARESSAWGSNLSFQRRREGSDWWSVSTPAHRGITGLTLKLFLLLLQEEKFRADQETVQRVGFFLRVFLGNLLTAEPALMLTSRWKASVIIQHRPPVDL